LRGNAIYQGSFAGYPSCRVRFSTDMRLWPLALHLRQRPQLAGKDLLMAALTDLITINDSSLSLAVSLRLLFQRS
jgi:hypothetical protein